MAVVLVVKKKSEFNMALANLHMKESELWSPFIQRQLQFPDEFLRIFIIHTTPGSN